MEKQVKYIHTTEVHNLNAPNHVVPVLMDMFNPCNVLDVGCGIGTWLYKFNEAGVKDIIGLDGNYVDRVVLKQYLTIDQFQVTDLTNSFDLRRKFDIVLSLEVAEHLPEPSAKTFIESLCRHGDIIIFSAAIPHQGGQNHLNEQWKEYWVNIFSSFDYKAYDIIRPIIWDNENIDWWYKQNMLVFSCKDLKEFLSPSSKIFDTVHPKLYMQHVDYIIYLQQYVKELEEKLYGNK